MLKASFVKLAVIGALAAPMAASAFVLGPTDPGKWGSPVFGTGATVTWSYMGDGVDCSADGGGVCSSFASFMPVGFEASVNAAFAAWSSVADLTFVQVADGGEAFNAPGTSGDIRLGGHAFDGPLGVLAHGYYPPVNGDTAAGDIHFDEAESWKLGWGGPGFNIYQVLSHELGHALGLDHSPVPNSLMNPFYTESFQGPQADDIAGMQYIYGPVPEPSTWALFALGVAALSLSRRRRTTQ